MLLIPGTGKKSDPTDPDSTDLTPRPSKDSWYLASEHLSCLCWSSSALRCLCVPGEALARDSDEMTDGTDMTETLSFSPRHASRGETQPRGSEGQDMKETSKISD